MSNDKFTETVQIEPEYMSYLGLSVAPFASAHEDRFLYLDTERLQCLNIFQQLIQQPNLLLMFRGQRGVGKTSLKQRLINQAKPGWRVCQLQANTLMDADLLLHEIALGFGLAAPPHDPASLYDVLIRHLLRLHQQQLTSILFIDDAHELPEDALQTIFTLADAEGEDGPLLRTIIFCEPQIETMLNDPAMKTFRSRITHTIDILPLSEEQTNDYIAHRLDIAGLQGISPFTSRDIHLIYTASNGVPSRINETAHKLLMNSSTRTNSEENPVKNQRLTSKQIMMGFLSLVIIGSIAFIFNQVTTSAPVPHQPATVAVEDNIILPVPTASKITSSQVAPEPVVPVSNEPEHEATAATIPVIETITPNPVTASMQAQTLTLAGTGFMADSKVTVEWNTGKKLLDQKQIKWLDSGTMQIRLTTGLQPDTWHIVVNNADGNGSSPASFQVTAPAKPAATNNGKLWDIEWIKQQPANSYTIQLLASQQKTSIEQYVKEHDLAGTAVAFSSLKNKQTLYSLIAGSYPDRIQAEKAVGELPASLENSKPWIRDFKGIQQSLARVAPDPTLTPKAPPSLGSLTEQAAWIWDQDPGRYTLQLLGSHEAAGIKSFITEHKLVGQAVYYRTIRDGQAWYVLVYGNYPDLNTAREASRNLPASLQKSESWPRSYGSVQADLQ